MTTTVTVDLPAALAQRVRDADTTAGAEVLNLVRAALPPDLAAGQRYTGPGGVVAEIVGFRDDLVILYWPARPDPGSRAGALPVSGVQDAVASGRWVVVPPPAPAPWVAGQAVSVGALRTYQGSTYRARQAHTTQADWTPSATPALWEVA